MDLDDDPQPARTSTIDPLVLRESITMGLYITISLLAVLSAKPHGGGTDAALPLVWGTTLGLVLAHWFAFRLTARLFAGEQLSGHDRRAIAGQVLAGFAVAGLASVPLLLHDSAGPALARGCLAGLIGLFAFVTARHHGGSHARAMVYALVVLAISLAVAVGKYLLTGH